MTPLLSLKRLPQAPQGIAGVFNYRGTPVPAVDLSQLTHGRPALERLSTRLLIVNCPAPAGQSRLLGLIAEQATDLLRKEAEPLITAGVKIRAAPYLGPVFMDSKGPIQLLYEQNLLSEPVRERLFAAALPASTSIPRANPVGSPSALR